MPEKIEKGNESKTKDPPYNLLEIMPEKIEIGNETTKN